MTEREQTATVGEDPSRTALLEAIASAWCVPPNENKRMDADLANTIADQVIGLKWLRPQMQTPSAIGRTSVPDDLWDDIYEFIKDHVDVVDGAYGEQRPNKAMNLMSRIDEELP